MTQPGGSYSYMGTPDRTARSECQGCGEYFDAATEMIRYREGHLQKWICMECHDKREWK